MNVKMQKKAVPTGTIKYLQFKGYLYNVCNFENIIFVPYNIKFCSGNMKGTKLGKLAFNTSVKVINMVYTRSKKTTHL